MKTIPIIIGFFVTAFGVHSINKSSSTDLTDGAYFNSEVVRISNLAKGLDFKVCGYEGFVIMCERLDLEIYRDTTGQFCKGHLACATDKIVVFETDWCDPCIVDIFFHEIGHVVLGHYGDDNKDAEVQADYFSFEVLKSLNITARCDRRYLYD